MPVTWGQSTHALAYSREAMQFIVNSNIQQPIDNFLVQQYQPKNNSYCSFPLLATQREGYSDIENTVLSWDKYITEQYERLILQLKQNKRCSY
jgi:hypothetical protein